MSTTVVSLSPERMSLIVIMSGQLTAEGEPTELTAQKWARALAVGEVFLCQPRPYTYVFPDCSRSPEGGQRVCDVLRLLALQFDPRCHTALVPPAEAEFSTNEQRLAFLNQVRSGVVGESHILM